MSKQYVWQLPESHRMEEHTSPLKLWCVCMQHASACAHAPTHSRMSTSHMRGPFTVDQRYQRHAIMSFTVQQMAQCVIWYAAEKSPTVVQRKFRAEFLHHCNGRMRVPDRKSIKEWYAKFLQSGSVSRKKRNNPRWIRTEFTLEAVMEKFQEDHHRTLRSVAKEEGMPSASTVWRILRTARFHPHKLHFQGMSQKRDNLCI